MARHPERPPSADDIIIRAPVEMDPSLQREQTQELKIRGLQNGLSRARDQEDILQALDAYFHSETSLPGSSGKQYTRDTIIGATGICISEGRNCEYITNTAGLRDNALRIRHTQILSQRLRTPIASKAELYDIVDGYFDRTRVLVGSEPYTAQQIREMIHNGLAGKIILNDVTGAGGIRDAVAGYIAKHGTNERKLSHETFAVWSRLAHEILTDQFVIDHWNNRPKTVTELLGDGSTGYLPSARRILRSAVSKLHPDKFAQDFDEMDKATDIQQKISVLRDAIEEYT